MKHSESNQTFFNQDPLIQQVHLSDYLAILSRRRKVIFFTFLTIVGLVTLYSFLITPTYQATSQIFIEVPSSPIKGIGEIDISRKQAREDYLQSVYQLLVSREVARQVAIRTNEHFGWTDNVPKPGEEPSGKPYYTAEQHLANLRVTPVTGFGLIGISVFNPSPETAAWLADLHAEVFIELYRKKNRVNIEKKFAWLLKQINDQKKKLEQSYQKLYAYQKEHGLAFKDQNTDIMQQKLVALNSALIEATAEKEAKEAVYKELLKYSRNDKTIFSIPLIAKDPILMDLRNKQLLLQREKAEMATAYGPRHSKMLELNKKEKYLAQQLEKEIQRVIRVGKEEAERAAAKEKLALKALQEQKQEIINLKEKAIKYDMLQREAESNQAIYDMLLAQSKQVNLSTMLEGNNIYLAEKAIVPLAPAKPRIALNILLAIILSGFLGTGLAFFVEYMDKKVRTPGDVSRYLNLPLLGVLPYEQNFSREKIFDSVEFSKDREPKNNSGYSYSYFHVLDWLPAELRLGQPGENGTVLLMASALAGEGKTTVLAKMAVRLGKAGFRVLAVDCDFQKPNLHTCFGQDNPAGLSNALHSIAEMDISAGNLSDCSVSDLYTLIELRKLSGQLTIANQGVTMMSFFENGRVLHIESTGDKRENRLGTMLLNGGFLTETQLQEALKRNRRTGQPFGYILLNYGYVTQEQLQGHLKLQTEEHLQKLFSWKKGTYSFEPGPVKNYANEKLYFKESYGDIIARQAQQAGNVLFEKNINQIVKDTDYENVCFVAAGNAVIEHGTPVDLRLLNKFMEIFRNSYHLILIDAPPVLEATDSSALAQVADGVVFVIRSGHLDYPVLQQALQRIYATNTRIVGTVLTQVKERDLMVS